jgi:polyvinyl alcohol dehydrogenase (cytochrome)
VRSPLAAPLALLVALSGCGGGSKGGDPPKDLGVDPIPAGDWPLFRRDCAGTSRSSAALPAAAAGRLAERWSASAGQPTTAQPVVADGRAFVTTAVVASVVALDVASGAALWTFPFDAKTSADCESPRTRSSGTQGAAAVAKGVVYAASPDGGVYALDAATGARRWRAAVASPAPHGELIQTSVVVSTALGRAYVGVASTAPCDQIPGRVAAVDLATGAVTSRTLVPDGRRGGAVWASLAVDEQARRVYAATGNAIGDPASEPLAQAIVALDAVTLEPLDAWQNPTPLVDADFGAAPTLFDAGGRALVAAASKDGWLYVLERARLAAGPVWKLQLAVTADDGRGGDPLAGYGSIVPPTFANGLLYAAGGRTPQGERGAVVALEPATGAVAWKHATPGPVLQPVAATTDVVAVVSASDAATVFTAGSHAALELLDAKTGALLGTYAAGGPSLSPPSLGGGKVLWSTFDGTLRALAVP